MDIYIKSGPTSTGFYKRDDARDFFDAVNKVAEESKPLGKFAWRALYNDPVLVPEMNKKYGARRLLIVPGHGPDNLHIHLDLRPLDVTKDEVSGYQTEGERVILNDD